MESSEARCRCSSLQDFAVLPMGGDRQDEQVFASLDLASKHGGQQWWLYASTCRICDQAWMIAQDERIHDNYYLKRLSGQSLSAILRDNNWPEDFLTYERVLKLGVDSGQVCRFADPQSPALVCTIDDLQRERPDISAEEIAILLAIPVEAAAALFKPS